jgi:glycosyltransferase involved in cell wall biosynthesis
MIAQTYTHWECIIVDDGSTDDTIQVVERFATHDSRFKIYQRPSDKPKGANACRNIGVEKSTGDFLVFLDSDDTLSVDSLQNRIAYFKKHEDVQGLIFSTGILSEDGKKVTPFTKEVKEGLNSEAYAKMLLSYDIPWQITNPIWKREIFEMYGGFDEQLARFQDVDIHTKFMLCGVSIKKIDIIDFYYRVEEGFEKYNDVVFITKACRAILYYIEKYLSPSDVYILNDFERKEQLSVMFRKTIRKFIYNKNRHILFKEYLKFAKQHQLLSRKTMLLLNILYTIDKNQLLNKKGLGFYKLEKYARTHVFNI